MANDPIEVTREEILAALKAGNLWVAITNGRWWQARANGAVKTWKRDASRFEIPIKFGFRDATRLTQDDAARSFPHYYLISKIDPNGKKSAKAG